MSPTSTTQSHHTPGPWTVSEMFNVPVGPDDMPEKAPSVWLDREADGATGLKLGFCSHVRRERIMADARLIAAAPDLYEALRALWVSVAARIEACPEDEWYDDELAAARAALAKVEGEESIEGLDGLA